LEENKPLIQKVLVTLPEVRVMFDGKGLRLRTWNQELAKMKKSEMRYHIIQHHFDKGTVNFWVKKNEI
jgi:hypothetical protein